MGIFSTVSPFDPHVEKATDEKKREDDWGQILEICDLASSTKNGSRECLKSIYKRLQHVDPHVVLQAATLLDACINNCGHPFRLEVASREFETEFKRCLVKTPHPKVQQRLMAYLKKWSEGEFASNPQYNIIPSLYESLRREGLSAGGLSQDGGGDSLKTGNSSSEKQKLRQVKRQEEEDLKKAIAMSLNQSSSEKKSGGNSNMGLMYPSNFTTNESGGSNEPSMSSEKKNKNVNKISSEGEGFKARAIYDFEAAEDNEMTFKAGELVIVLDDSDENWWKGSNHRGQGLFPSNFVSTEPEAVYGINPNNTTATTHAKTISDEKSGKNEAEVMAQSVSASPPMVSIDIELIDKVLNMLNDSDPSCEEPDSRELLELEHRVVNGMAPLIDNQLEKVDRRLAELTKLSCDLVEAINLYHQLMKESIPTGSPGSTLYGPGSIQLQSAPQNGLTQFPIQSSPQHNMMVGPAPDVGLPQMPPMMNNPYGGIMVQGQGGFAPPYGMTASSSQPPNPATFFQSGMMPFYSSPNTLPQQRHQNSESNTEVVQPNPSETINPNNNP